jgi:hypothetical protein
MSLSKKNRIQLFIPLRWFSTSVFFRAKGVLSFIGITSTNVAKRKQSLRAKNSLVENRLYKYFKCLPLQVTPSPLYPVVQEQVNEPGVFKQFAREL